MGDWGDIPGQMILRPVLLPLSWSKNPGLCVCVGGCHIEKVVPSHGEHGLHTEAVAGTGKYPSQCGSISLKPGLLSADRAPVKVSLNYLHQCNLLLPVQLSHFHRQFIHPDMPEG